MKCYTEMLPTHINSPSLASLILFEPLVHTMMVVPTMTYNTLTEVHTYMTSSYI